MSPLALWVHVTGSRCTPGTRPGLCGLPWPFKNLWTASEASRLVWCLPSLGFVPTVSATSPLDGRQDGDSCPPQNSTAANTEGRAWSKHPGAGARGTSPGRELSLGWGGGGGNQAGDRDLEAGRTQQGLVLEIACPAPARGTSTYLGLPQGEGNSAVPQRLDRAKSGSSAHRCGCPPGPRWERSVPRGWGPRAKQRLPLRRGGQAVKAPQEDVVAQCGAESRGRVSLPVLTAIS